MVTEKQYRTLLGLGSGNAGIAWRKRTVEPLLRHGWVTAEWREPFYSWVRITPDGLRALALAVERYGLPEMRRAEATVNRRVCVECGSSRFRFVDVAAESVAA